MGFLPIPGSTLPDPSAPLLNNAAQAVEVTMFSQGLRIRIGPEPDDLCRIEELSIGEPVWDLTAGRLVDIEAMGCVTLDGAQLAELGLRPMALAQGGWFALASARLLAPPPRQITDLGPTVFFRVWPDSRVLAEVEGRPVLLRHGFV